MSQLILSMRAITPLFLAGADNQTPELRPASFRGVLRYWLRALLGTEHGSDLNGLKQAESAIFGNTNAGSPISVRAYSRADGGLLLGERRVLPHSGDSHKQFSKKAFVEKSQFSLELAMRPGQSAIPKQGLAALLLFIYQGGIGNRARRGFGSLQIDAVQSHPEALGVELMALLQPQAFANGAVLADHMQQVLNWSLGTVETAGHGGYSAETIPDYPTLHPDHAKVLVCRYPFDPSHYHQAMIDFWDRLRKHKYRSHERAFGYASGGRRSSPLHLHIAQSKEGYHLVMTVLRSKPEPEGTAGWTLVSEFLQERAAAWDGVYLLGGGDLW